MKNRPSVIEKLWTTLLAQGLSEEEVAHEEAGPKSLQAAAVATKGEKRKAEAQQVQQDGAAAGDANPQDPNFVPVPRDPMPPKIEKVEDLSAASLRDKVLPLVDPVIMSSQNLKSIRLTGAQLKNVLLEFWEFATGLPRSYPVKYQRSCFNQLGTYGNMRANDRGRRCLALTLPPDFDEQGLAEKRGLDQQGNFLIKHRFTGEEIVVKKQDIPPFASVDQLFIKNNHSEELLAVASKMSPTSDVGHLLANYFKKSMVSDDGAARVVSGTLCKRRKAEVSDMASPGASSLAQSPASMKKEPMLSGDSQQTDAQAPPPQAMKNEDAESEDGSNSSSARAEPVGAAAVKKESYDESLMDPPP